MANKNHSGTQLVRAIAKEERLIDCIDKRTNNGSDRKNVDHAWQNHSVSDDGERIWSF